MNLRQLTFLSDRVVQSFYALRDNRLRSILSIVGIAVGIAAVMAVGTVSKGGSYLVFSELETFGLNSVWVYRDRNDKDPHRLVRPGSGIDNYDYLAIHNCCDAVDKISPVIFSHRERMIIQTHNRYSNAQLYGVNRDYLAINNDKVSSGRPFRAHDIERNRAVAIIGPTVSTDLFGEHVNPIGEEIRIGLRRFTIIGLLDGKSRDFLASIGSAGGQDANNRILIPYGLMQQMRGDKQINFFHIKAASLDAAPRAAKQVIRVLDRRNGNNYSYTSETMSTYIKTAQRILDGVAMIGIVAASISLIVGGLGIMNIMSTSVLERTREIGLRKAIGASKRDILFQFLLEAIIISTIGGLIGLSLGSLVSILLAHLTGFPLTPSVWVIAIALTVSILVGVSSGYLPARRASQLHPVEALRYE